MASVVESTDLYSPHPLKILQKKDRRKQEACNAPEEGTLDIS